MSTYTSVNPATLQRAAADVQQLTQPIHIAIRRRIITHPPLLDQLRKAAQPGSTVQGPERRPVARSRPPVRLVAVDALSTVYVELSGWKARLNLPAVPAAQEVDWFKATLRQLVGAMPQLAPDIADWCATEISDWWRLSAVHSGWRPAELLRLR